MLRDFQNTLNKPADSSYKAEVAMKTGAGVVKNYAGKTVGFPAAETASGIFVVTKERIPAGVDAGRGDMSDYDASFTTVSAGELVKLASFDNQGEAFGTDQYVATDLVEGVRVAVGVDGKWKKAGAAVASRYVFTGLVSDAGHTLARIEIVTEAAVNA